MRPRLTMARPLVRRMGAAAHEEPHDPQAYEKAVAAQKPAGGVRLGSILLLSVYMRVYFLGYC